MSSKLNSSKSQSQDPEMNRCVFAYADGRRCRNQASGVADDLCMTHERFLSNQPAKEARAVSVELLGDYPDLDNRDEVHDMLARLFRLLSERRISREDGSLYAYIASLVLQTLPLRESSRPEDQNFEVVWDIPRLETNATQNDTPNSIYPPHNAGPQG